MKDIDSGELQEPTEEDEASKSWKESYQEFDQCLETRSNDT